MHISILEPAGMLQLHLLQRDKSRRVCCTNAGLSMLDRLVGNGELCQVMSHHVWLDFYLYEQRCF